MGSMVGERDISAHTQLLEFTPALRRLIEETIEELVALLDTVDARAEDLEEPDDDEPSLGWASGMAFGLGDEHEDEDDNGLADLDGAAEQGFLPWTSTQ